MPTPERFSLSADGDYVCQETGEGISEQPMPERRLIVVCGKGVVIDEQQAEMLAELFNSTVIVRGAR